MVTYLGKGLIGVEYPSRQPSFIFTYNPAVTNCFDILSFQKFVFTLHFNNRYQATDLPLYTQEASSPEGFTCVLTSATWMASFGGCTLEQEYCTCLPGGAYGLVGQADTSPPPNASRAGARQMEDSHIEIL